MKIDSQNPDEAVRSRTSTQVGRTASSPAAQGSAIKSGVSSAIDRVSVSSEATELASTAAAHTAPPEATPERLAELKSAILAGALRIDPEALARAILEHEDLT